MGLIDGLFGLLFGSGRNALRETVEIFRENAEKGAARESEAQMASLAQFAAEFAHPRRARFDVLIDGLNRVPRPAMALGTIGLFVAAMVDPTWFAARMAGLAHVPEPLWWLLGAIVSFYFGARHQLKGQEFQKSLAETLARAPRPAAPAPARTVAPAEAVKAPVAAAASKGSDPYADNAALRDWHRGRAAR
ncbi:MAG: holin family protein [Pseudomonadota bacterium]